MKATNLRDEADKLREYWSPKVIGRVNDQYVKVAKLKGDLTWHKHDNEDELFYIIKGDLVIEYKDRKVRLSEGDFHIVPRGELHNPVCSEECWVALIETTTTEHTGDVVTAKTKSVEAQLAG